MTWMLTAGLCWAVWVTTVHITLTALWWSSRSRRTSTNKLSYQWNLNPTFDVIHGTKQALTPSIYGCICPLCNNCFLIPRVWCRISWMSIEVLAFISLSIQMIMSSQLLANTTLNCCTIWCRIMYLPWRYVSQVRPRNCTLAHCIEVTIIGVFFFGGGGEGKWIHPSWS